MSSTAEISLPLPAPESWVRRFVNYGWGTILVGALAMAATYPGRTHGLGTITEPMQTDLGLADDDGRVFYSSLNLWATLIGALFCLPAGWLLDRYDRRWILAGNFVCLGLTVLWMSVVQSWEELFAALILTRGLGQSALSVVSITVVAKSFSSRRFGFAMAWYSIFVGVFFSLMGKTVGWAITEEKLDWRTIWGRIGMTLTALALTAFFIRGKGDGAEAGRSAESAEQDGSTLWQALATPAFWVISCTISIWGMISAGFSLFNEHIFRGQGFGKEIFFHVVVIMPIIAVAANFFFGWLVRYVKFTYLLTACLLTTSASLYGWPYATQPWHAYAYAVAAGISSGAVTLLFFAAWRTMFGPRELGRIQSVAQMMTVFASAAGPLVFALGNRADNSYAPVFHKLAAAVFVLALIACVTPMPRFTKETAT